MSNESSDQVRFQTVYKFCSQDTETYLEVLEEIRNSINNLVELIKSPQSIDIEQLRFIRHKMKSTFRILEDDDFRELLDEFTQAVQDQNEDLTNKLADSVNKLCQEYETKLFSEMEKYSGTK